MGRSKLARLKENREDVALRRYVTAGKQKTVADLKKRALDVLGPTLDPWAHQCHAASIALVKAGVGDRVARGWCAGVTSQHSWVVVGMDCYSRKATIIDPTLWSYDDNVKGILVTTNETHRYRPHGEGSIWDWGRPSAAVGPAIKLKPKLSALAQDFVNLLGPLDRNGWHMLASVAPVEGWPAGEILAAINATPELACLVPIDRIGMLTSKNPGGVYLREKDTVK